MSVSLYQDGPALADQGTIVAAQIPVEYAKVHAQQFGLGGGQSIGVARPVRVMQPGMTNVSYPNIQAMPNAHFGQSKEGIYMPLHLDMLDEGWRGIHDLQLWTAGLSSYPNPSGSIAAGYIIPVSATAPTPGYPYPTAVQTFYPSSVAAPTGDPICAPANVKWGFSSGTNISWQSRITCYVRHGWEVQVLPTSQLSSLQRVSPRFDPVALDNYARICRELKDAYPVDYNDLNKLWEVLKAAAKVAGPAISMLSGGVGAVAGPLVSGASALLDILTTKKGSKSEHERSVRRTDTMPAAAKETAASIIASPVVQTVRPPGLRRRGQRVKTVVVATRKGGGGGGQRGRKSKKD
jgi:hypothetical protein